MGSPLSKGAFLELTISVSCQRERRLKRQVKTHARIKSPMIKHKTGASPMVSNNVAVVSRLDLLGFMAVSPSAAPAIRKPARTRRGKTMERHVYGFLPP